MAGIRSEGAPAGINPTPPRPEGDESVPLLPVSMQRDTSACPGNGFSSNTYLSPSVSQGENSSTVIDSAYISQSVSSFQPASAAAEVGTQTSDPSQDRIQLDLVDPRNESLAKIMQAYRGREYEKPLERDKDLGTRQDLDHEETRQLRRRISMLKSTIEKIATMGANLVKELANDLTPDERRALERDIDIPKARKSKELESVMAEHTQLLQRISGRAHDLLLMVREQQDAFVSNAKAHIKDMVAVKDGVDAVLAFLNGLPTGRVSI